MEKGSKLRKIEKKIEEEIVRKFRHKPLNFEYSQITKYIYIGTNMCCGTHLDPELVKRKIKAVISLEKRKVDRPLGAEYYLWLPTKDKQALSLTKLRIGVALLKEITRQKTKCYIHCDHGNGRAPTLVAAFLVSEGMDTMDAFDSIKEKRPDIHPSRKQVAMVKKFEMMYRKYMSELLFA